MILPCKAKPESSCGRSHRPLRIRLPDGTDAFRLGDVSGCRCRMLEHWEFETTWRMMIPSNPNAVDAVFIDVVGGGLGVLEGYRGDWIVASPSGSLRIVSNDGMAKIRRMTMKAIA